MVRKLDQLKRQLSLATLAQAHITTIMGNAELLLKYMAIWGQPDVYQALLNLDQDGRYLELEVARIQRQIKRIERRFRRNVETAEKKAAE